jgi:hypothetical protein
LFEAPDAYCSNILLNSARDAEEGSGDDRPGRTLVGLGSAGSLFSATHLRISSILSLSTGLNSTSAVSMSGAAGVPGSGENAAGNLM